jgi:predicted MFS family arabinose efflux permease
MTTIIAHPFQPTLRWNLRQLYWDIFWFGILAGSTLAFQAVYAARLGATGFQIGLLSAGPAVVNLICTLPSGRWLEGKSFIKVSFQSSIWQRLGYVFLVALPWLFNSSEGQVWGLIWTTLVMSVAGTILAIAFNALFAEVVPPEARAQAVGKRNTLLAISITLATLLSGQILDRVVFPANYQIVFLIGGVGAMMSSYHIGRLRRHDPNESIADVDKIDDNQASLITKRRPLLRLDLLTGSFGIFMLSYMAFYAFQYFPIPLFPIAYVDKLHMTDGMIGIGNAIFYGAMMLASFRLVTFSARYGHRKVLIASAALFPIFPLFLGVAKGPVLYYLACLIGGGINAMLSGAIINRLMEKVPSDDRPAHMALHNLALNLGILGGSLLGPVSANLMGVQPSLILSAGLRLLAAGFFWLWG